MKIGIYGYGNLGRGVESAAKYNADIEIVGVFTRRDPKSVATLTGIPVYSASDILSFKDKIDVLPDAGAEDWEEWLLSPICPPPK